MRASAAASSRAKFLRSIQGFSNSNLIEAASAAAGLNLDSIAQNVSESENT
jgi:hypothetical protein